MTKTAGVLIAVAGVAAGYAIAKFAPQLKLAIEDSFASDGPDSDLASRFNRSQAMEDAVRKDTAGGDR